MDRVDPPDRHPRSSPDREAVGETLMARRRRGRSPGKFVSKAQWRYLHARFGHKGFVKRWAQKQRGQYRALPKKKRGR